jgi:predicted DNA-binding protein with PD1-like motif
MRRILAITAMLLCLTAAAAAQDAAPTPEYVTRPATPETGKAPGLKATELSPKVRIFQLVFAKGDEVGAGLAEFADKNHLTDYKTIRLNEEMEVTSFIGNITRDRAGKPVVHAHCVVALLRNGAVYSGHFVEGHISLTMQMSLEDSPPLQTATAAGN